MLKGLLVKRLLAETVEKLILKEEIPEITVNDIITEAGVSRTTFYRYFKDKYDLINYIYTNYMIQLSRRYNYMEKPYETTVEILRFFQSKRVLFLKIFEYAGQNSFSEFFVRQTFEYDMGVIKGITNEEVSKHDRYAILYNAMGWSTLIYNWLLDGCEETPEEMVDMLYEFTPKRIHSYYAQAMKKE